MGIEEITSAITTLGFPIICVIACGYFINNMIKSQREENQNREERYIETINKFSTVLEKVNENLINNNKRLEYIENKLDEICLDNEK